jgi:hypothetical protein
MNPERVLGSCLCGEVGYAISGSAGIFQYCHCSRCRKFTGSAHAANLFVRPNQFSWTQGQDFVGTFAPDNTKHFATAFCKRCGSSLPWQNKSGTIVVIPAGTLDGDPEIAPTQNIFWSSRASWYEHASGLPLYDALPPR